MEFPQERVGTRPEIIEEVRNYRDEKKGPLLIHEVLRYIEAIYTTTRREVEQAIIIVRMDRAKH